MVRSGSNYDRWIGRRLAQNCPGQVAFISVDVVWTLDYCSAFDCPWKELCGSLAVVEDFGKHSEAGHAATTAKGETSKGKRAQEGEGQED